MTNDFGIIALEVYFPRFYVAQSDLEAADGCVGKYTRGLGQDYMGFCSIEEDINSICLTAFSNLIDRTKVDLNMIGFLEVGSETVIDKSKSTKTFLMQLFESCGNFDVQGVDVKNACFGGTAALFHALDWLESSCWDGRLAVVIAGDIAVYGTKSARPTAGAGAVAMLLGPNAPLIVDPGLRAHYVTHRYDFYKPDLSSEYPTVDGQLSMNCYREALDACYTLYKRKSARKGSLNVLVSAVQGAKAVKQQILIDYICFHSPFCRLVQKALGWLILNDIRCLYSSDGISNLNVSRTVTSGSTAVDFELIANPDWQSCCDPVILTALKEHCTPESTTSARDVDSLCTTVCADLFRRKVEPGLLLAKNVGNMYTASLYSCLASLLMNVKDSQLHGRRILMYSYGSGLAASMFSIFVHPTRDLSGILNCSITNQNEPVNNQSTTKIKDRLFKGRTCVSVNDLNTMLEERRKFHNAAPYTPPHRPEGLFPGSYYLAHVDAQYRRTYRRC